MNHRFDKLLVLDLDETLIHSTTEPPKRKADFRVGRYWVFKRPGLEGFVQTCLKWFEVGVWTSAGQDYAVEIVSQVFTAPELLAFLWARPRCTRRTDPETGEDYWLKDLKKLRRRRYELAKIIVVDDDSRKLRRQYGNLVPVREYTGDVDDNELPLLLRFLETLGPVPDVRAVEKRCWRSILRP